MKKQHLTSRKLVATAISLSSLSLLSSTHPVAYTAHLFDGPYQKLILMLLIASAILGVTAALRYAYHRYHVYQLHKTVEEAVQDLRTVSHDVQTCAVEYHDDTITITTKLAIGGKLETKVFKATSHDLDENVMVLVRQLHKLTEELRLKRPV